MPNGKNSKVAKKNRKPNKGMRKSDDANKSFKAGKAYKVKPEVFPRILYSRLKFTDDIQITCSNTFATALTYRLNSIYDPRYASGGRTCVGQPALASLYGNYLVLGAKVQLSFCNPTQDGLRVGYRLRINGDNPVSAGYLQTVSEQPLTYISGLNNTGSQKKNFNLYVKPWTLIGTDKATYLSNIATNGAAISANPTSYCWIDIFAVNPYVTTSQTVDVLVKIVYYVKFYNRIALVSA